MFDLKADFNSVCNTILESLPKLGLSLLVAIVLIGILRLLRVKSTKFLIRKSDDPLLVTFIDSVFYVTNIIIGILLFLYLMGFGGIASSVLGAAGVSAFIIGFAFKDIGENLLAGILMAFNRPFKLGDTIMSGGIEGKIVEISLRDTHIKTFDGKDVYIPNGQIIKSPLWNYTIDGFLRGSFIVGIDYQEDVERVREILLETVQKVPGVLTSQKTPRTHVKTLNVNTIDIEVHYWMDTFDPEASSLEIKSLAQTRCLEALTQAGVSLPGQIVELKNYDDHPLIIHAQKPQA